MKRLRPGRVALAFVALACTQPTIGRAAAASPLSAQIAPLGFLVGDWIADSGQAQGGRTLRGGFSIEPVVEGQALLRRDHTQLLAPGGGVEQSFEQIMLIYPEAGGLHADYFDGGHTIHYVGAAILPGGGGVRFDTAHATGMPAFRLTYAGLGPDRLSVRFEIQAPGRHSFQTIAQGTAHRATPAR